MQKEIYRFLFQIIRAYHRILDLKEKHVDCEVLEILVNAITNNLQDNYEQPSFRLHGAALKLFGRLTGQVTSDSKIWELYASLSAAKGPDTPEVNLESRYKQCQFMQKSLSSYTQKTPGWETYPDQCKEVCRIAMKYVSGNLK